MAKYNPIVKCLQGIYWLKLLHERAAHQLWPKYTLYKKDKTLTKVRWDIKYCEKNGIKRRIFWDMTVSLIKSYQFADLQHRKYSSYYAGYCFKGGASSLGFGDG